MTESNPSSQASDPKGRAGRAARRLRARHGPLGFAYTGGVRDYIAQYGANTLFVPLPQRCPVCNSTEGFAYSGWDPRHLLCVAQFMPDGEDGDFELWTRRVRCLNPDCGRTFTMLPSFRAAVQALRGAGDRRLCA